MSHPCSCGDHTPPPNPPGSFPFDSEEFYVPDRPGIRAYLADTGHVVIVDERGGLESAVSIAIHPDHLPALGRWLRQVAKPAVRRQLLVAMQEHERQHRAVELADESSGK